MKKILILLLCAFALGLECNAQYNVDKVILYGAVRADGHQKATKGAFWKTRPEAKIIYEGGEPPPGYTVYKLAHKSFVRYIEHNNSDDNYIVFEEGAVVYTDASGQFYDSYCGNKIEYIGPIERFIIQEKVVVKEPSGFGSGSSFSGFGSGLGTPTLPQATGQKVNQGVQDFGTSSNNEDKEKKEVKIGKILLRVGEGGLIVGAITVIVKSLLKGNPGGSPITPDTGGPGGSPITP